MSVALNKFDDTQAFPPAEQIGQGGEGVRQGRCTGCPLIVKQEGIDCCSDPVCFEAKTNHWRSFRLAQAHAIQDLKYYNEKETPYWATEDFNYGEAAEHGPEIVKQGCPKENLRLYWDPDDSRGVRVLPDVRVICARGSGKTCQCVQKMKRTTSKEPTPREVAEKEAKQRLDQEIVQPAVVALQAELETMSQDAWRLMLKRITYGLHKDQLDKDWTAVCRHVARKIVNGATGWNPHERPERARTSIDEMLHPVGIRPAYPDGAPGDPRPDILRRWERVKLWIERLPKELPAYEAVQGNITNLEKIWRELNDLPVEMQEEIMNGEVRIAWEKLRKLLPVIRQSSDLESQFEDVSWLYGTPPGDINFDSHLKKAGLGVIRYTLTLLHGQYGGNKQRIERLEARIRALGVDHDFANYSMCIDCQDLFEPGETEHCAKCNADLCENCYIERDHFRHDPERDPLFDDLAMEAKAA